MPKEEKKTKKRAFEKLAAADAAAAESKKSGDGPTKETDEKAVFEDPKEEDAAAGDDGKRKRKRNRTRKPKGGKVEDDDDGNEGGEGEGNGKKAAGPSVEGTVYVEGISYDADDADVQGFFEQVGPVTAVRMPRWHDSGKPRGYAHVVFRDEKHVKKAVSELNGQRLMGRYLKVALPNAPKTAPGGPTAPPPEGCRTIFVKNLPYDTDEGAVRAVMSTFGEVKDVRLATATGGSGQLRLKGFGYVQFASELGAKRAGAAAGAGTLQLSGRALYVDYDAADAKPKGSFRRTDGKLWKEGEAL